MARKRKTSSKIEKINKEIQRARDNSGDCANCKSLLGIIEILMDIIQEQEVRIEQLENGAKSEKSSKVFEQVENKSETAACVSKKK